MLQCKTFEVANISSGEEFLNKFLAQDGKAIAVDKIFTAASGTECCSRLYVTVVYNTLEQSPRE